MRWYRVTALMLVLSSLLNLSAQTLTVSLESLRALRDELLNSKVLLSNSEKEVTKLQQSLSEAKRSQETLNQTISDLNLSLEEARRLLKDSGLKIADLEKHLSEALLEQGRLRSRILFLETRLIELSASLTSLKKDFDDAMDRHIQEVIDLTAMYNRMVKVYRIATWVLGSVVVGGVVYAGLNSLE
jgi:chromosome segregation ATPase